MNCWARTIVADKIAANAATAINFELAFSFFPGTLAGKLDGQGPGVNCSIGQHAEMKAAVPQHQ
jgi:hypothetical protein